MLSRHCHSGGISLSLRCSNSPVLEPREALNLCDRERRRVSIPCTSSSLILTGKKEMLASLGVDPPPPYFHFIYGVLFRSGAVVGLGLRLR